MSETRRAREPVIVGIRLEKSLTYGTSGLMTTTNFAPRSTATSTLVVERMPPSMNSRPLTSTGS
jgi:hypothetical protein